MLPVAPTTNTVMWGTVMLTPLCSRGETFVRPRRTGACIALRVSEHNFMSGAFEDRPELAAHQPRTQNADPRIRLPALLSFERSHVNREAVFHIRLEQSLV